MNELLLDLGRLRSVLVRRRGDAIDRRHENIARSAQARLEAAMTALAATLPPGEPLCLSGGVAPPA